MAYVAGPEVLDAVRRASTRAAIEVHGDMKRGVSSLASIATIAPFVGVLGTVLGIVNSFHGVGTEKWTVYAMEMQSLSEALMPIELGLFVALLAYFGHTYLMTKLEDFDVEMENASLQLINQLASKKFS